MRVEPAERRMSRPPGDAPWPVKAYVALTLISSVLWMLLVWVETGDVASLPWLSPILGIAIAIGLLRGYRGAWLVAMFFVVLGMLGVTGLVQ